MFENDLLERFSRIHPVTPFVVWLPLMFTLLYRSWARQDLPVGGIAGLFVLGFFTWTLTEYVLHRWVFHHFENNPKRTRIHFLLHGVHHDFPTDKDRLVMPLLTSVPIGVIVSAVFYLVMGMRLAEPAFAGFTIGYLTYDGTHFALHHFKQTSRFGKWLKRHHMLHHHMDHAGGFGVSSPLWDYVFRTMPKVKKPVAAKSKQAAAQAS